MTSQTNLEMQITNSTVNDTNIVTASTVNESESTIIIEDVEEKKEEVKVNMTFTVALISISDIDSSTQTFSTRFECWSIRELTDFEVEIYLKCLKTKDFSSFKPIEIQIYPLKAVEVKEIRPFIFPTGKTYTIEASNSKKDTDNKNSKADNDQYNLKKSTGTVRKRFHIQRCRVFNIVWSQSFDANNFPFEYQDLEMILQFRDYEEKNWDLNNLHKYYSIEFDIENCLFANWGNTGNVLGWNFEGIEMCTHYSQAFLRIKVSRQWSFFLYRIGFILAIISLISIFTFSIPIDDNGSRFGFLATMLLAAVSYLFVVSMYLPPLNYLTLLEKYVLFTFMFLMMVSVECGLQTTIQDRVEDWFDSEFSVNIFFIILDASLWLLFHLYFVISSCRAYKSERKEKTMSKSQIDPVSILGKWCMVTGARYDYKYDIGKLLSDNGQTYLSSGWRYGDWHKWIETGELVDLQA